MLSRPAPLWIYAWLSIFFAVLTWSAIDPKDGLTWFLEVAPAIIAFCILVYSYRSFPLTSLSYALTLTHCLILMVGGHYTYADVPLFNDIAQLLGSDRNNYDKFGHFAQGFGPAIIAREIFIRLQVVKNRRWMNFLIICFCLGFSAFYELIEWWVALASGEDAVSFLGTQGYIWDTQSDMALALVGALCALFFLANYHDQQLRTLNWKA